MKRFINLLILAGLLMLWAGASAQKTDQPDLYQIPQKVMDALKAKFPEFKIEKWTKEQEGDIVIYDFEFTQGGHKFEADIKEDGTINNWEKAIAAKDLPEAVWNTVNNKYPSAKLIEIMEITAINEGKDQLEGYEIVLKTSDKEQIEITVAPDGIILEEDTGD
jgi:hypothetical protein